MGTQSAIHSTATGPPLPSRRNWASGPSGAG